MNETFEKVSVDDEYPSEEGKYVVFTKTNFGNGNVINITLQIREKDGKSVYSWGCTNQIVTHWLKQI